MIYKPKIRWEQAIFIFTFIMFFGVNSANGQTFPNTLTDLIDPLNLVSGKIDSVLISDMFYADNYGNIEIVSNPHIEVKFNYDKTKFIFSPSEDFEGMTLIDFEFRDNIYEIPVRVSQQQFVTFSFESEKNYEKVFLFGSFNSWNKSDLEMKNINGKYEIKIPLEPGRYQYKFFAEGSELIDLNNPEKIPNGMGDYNSVLAVEPKHKTQPFLHILDSKINVSSSTFTFLYSNDNSSTLVVENIISLLDNKKVAEKNVQINGDTITISLNKADLNDKKTLRVAINRDNQATNIQHIIHFDGKPAGTDNRNFTWHDAIIYSALIDRYNDGDKSINKPVIRDSLFQKANYLGGDFQGMVNKLEEGYFDSLGITTIWISPVYDNTDSAFREYPEPHRWFSGYHGYWPVKAREVEDKFGSFEKLKELVSVAHKHNVKILLDIVAHHVHEDHPYFKNHRDWFGNLELPDGRLNLRLWDEHRLTTWFEPFMPSFDFINSQDAVNAVADDAIWWLEETGADGFRQDAVKHIPNNFWQTLNRKLKKEVEIPEQKKVFQMGETFGSYDLVKSYVNNGQLPAQFNFNLYDVAVPTFLNQNTSFEQLDKEIKKSLYIFGENNLMGNIMDSQDKDRFMAYADSDLTINDPNSIEIGWNNPPAVDYKSSYLKERLYLAYLLSIPGVPTIFYGDEIGMTGAADPDNRRMMRFGNQLTTDERENLAEVSKLIHLRKNHSALRYGDYFSLKADTSIFVYVRTDINERVLIVINKNPEAQNITIDLPDFYGADSLVDLLNNESISVNNYRTEIPIDGIGYRFFNIIKKN
jgi:cyclomaltodextrinase